jgi:hypothetical protein
MSKELSTVEESMKEVLINLMNERVTSERVIFVGVQSSSTRGVQASPSNARGSGPSRPTTKKRTKHIDDLENAKLILTILLDYILPLVDAMSRDSVPRDFEYTMVTAYLPKGIRVVRAEQDKIIALKFNDFNLEDHKNHSMLTPFKYLTKMKGNNLKIIPQPWMMNLAQSTLLNVMKIPHFGRHREVNACVKILISCYHGDYLWLDHHITVDPTLIHKITGLSMKGPDLQDFYLGKATYRTLAQKIKDTYDDVEKGTQGYKVASIQNSAVCLACQLIVGKIVRKK